VGHCGLLCMSSGGGGVVKSTSGMNSAEFKFTNKNESKNEPENDHF